MEVAQPTFNSKLPKGLLPTVINGFNSASYSKTVQSKSKTSNQSYLDLGTTNAHLSTKQKRRATSEKLLIKRETRLKLVEFLSLLGESEYAESMSSCGEKWRSIMCADEHIASKIPFHRCNIRFCPMCANRRAAKFVKNYLPFAVEFIVQNPRIKPCLLTLTQRKIKGESKKAARARVLESFKKLQRRRFFDDYFAGGIWACEITESETGNHSHIHAVIFRRKFIDEKLLKSEWSKVSEGAKNLNIKLIDNLEGGLRECIKYIAKPIPADRMTVNSVKEILQLKSLRMIDTFGEFRKFKATFELPEMEKVESDKPEFAVGECCAVCEKPLFERIETEIEMITRIKRREKKFRERRE